MDPNIGQFENSSGESPQNGRRPVWLWAGIGVGIIILAVLAFLIWQKVGGNREPAVPQTPTNQNANNAVNGNVPANAGAPLNGNAPANANTPPSDKLINNSNLLPGIDRQLTAEEKAYYNFPADSDIWVRTSEANGNIGPQASFYVKNPPPPTLKPDSTQHIE